MHHFQQNRTAQWKAVKEEVLSLHLRQLLILISRQRQGGHKTADYVQNEMEAAIRRFYKDLESRREH